MGLDRIGTSSEEEHKEKQNKKAEQVKGDSDNIPNPKFSMGLNVVHLLPPVDSMSWPITRKKIHFRPFHACGRQDPAYDYEKKEWVDDSNFSNCYRCQKAFDIWENAGKPKGDSPMYDKFLTDMDNTYDVVQVVDLSGFFEMDSRGTSAKLNKQLFDRWWDTFLEIAENQDEYNSLDELPEEMPKEMKISALNFPSFIACPCTKTDLGGDIRAAYQDKKGDNEYEGKEPADPCLRPFSDLFHVDVSKSGTFMAGGQERASKSYTVKITKDRNLDGLDIPPASEGGRYWELIAERALDLEDPKCLKDDPSLEERAQSLEELTNEEIETYLNECGHQFVVDDGDSDSSSSDDESKERFSEVDDEMDSQKAKEVESVKKQMHADADDSGDEDDVFEGEEIPH